MDITFKYRISLHTYISIIILCIASFNIFASTSEYTPPHWHPIVSLNLGAAISSDIGNSKDFPIINPMTDEFYYYSADNPTQTAFLLGGFLGGERDFLQKYRLQIGLDYNETFPFSAKGTYVQGADSESANTYSYRYRIITRQLLAESKWIYPFKERWYPYLLVGLGAAFNNSYHYRTNVPPNLTLTRDYSDKNTTSFSYAVGFGIDADITSHIRFGLGYRFTDLGKASLGDGHIDSTDVSGTLSQSNLYANEVLAQLTYIFI